MTFTTKKFIYLLLGLAILTTAIFLWLYRDTYLYGLGKVTSYKECVKAGGSVLPGKKTNSCFYNNKLYNEPASNTSTNTQTDKSASQSINTAPSGTVNSPQADTSTWKTYTNAQYGIAFNYPENYLITSGENNSSIVITSPNTSRLTEGSTGESTDAIFINMHATDSNLKEVLTLSEPIQFSESYFKLPQQNDGDIQIYLGKITVNDRTGFQLRHFEANDNKYTIFKNSGGSYLLISTEIFSNGNIKNPATTEPYDSIIKTIKFTK